MRVASINWYVGNQQPEQDADRIEKLDIDVAGLQEAWRHVSFLRKNLDKYRVMVGKPTKGSREVAVLLNKKHKVLDSWGKEVSDLEPGEETKVMKSRWITVVKFVDSRQKYALINYHGNAVVQNRRTGDLLQGVERVREWVEAARTIEKTIKRLKRNGYKVFVTGDFNYRRFKTAKFVLSYWSPQRIFKRNGLEWVEHGLDYVAWSKSLRKVREIVVPKEKHGGDHDWLVVDVV